MTVVKAEKLTKTFKDFWNRPKAKAVNQISFNISRGETIGLLGPNGSGKSTTIKMLLGLLYPTSGKLEVLGASPRSIKSKKMIGYLPEETYLYRYLTSFETLDFFGSLFKIPKAERKKRVLELLDMVGLSSARNRRVGEFSKGMARRIGIAQAMINNPDFLILDEPTSGLDPVGCSEMKNLINLFQKKGKTILICSHLLGDIEDMCDRILIMFGGKIYAEGSLKSLLKKEDKLQLTLPLLSQERTENILSKLRKDFNEPGLSFNHPQIKLEDYFLKIINELNSKKIATSGAQTGGKLPDFLSQDNV